MYRPPDFIIEVLSPSTGSYDWIKKYAKYLKAGVKEYWLVDPQIKVVFVHILKDGIYEQTRYSEIDIVPVKTLPGCEINLSLVFK